MYRVRYSVHGTPYTELQGTPSARFAGHWAGGPPTLHVYRVPYTLGGEPRLIIAVCNQKGGVGKTTTVANLGVALAEQQRRVLLLDFDPQGSLTISFGLDPAELSGTTVYEGVVLLESDPHHRALASVIRRTRFGVDLAPADIDLAAAEIDLVGQISREMALARALRTVRGQYDYILIDTPPSLGLLTLNAMAAASHVIIPLATNFLSTKGVQALLRTVHLVRERLNPDLDVAGILATMHEGHKTHHAEVLEATRNAFAGHIRVFDAVIKRSVRFEEAPVDGIPAVIYARDLDGARAYRALALEVAALA